VTTPLSERPEPDEVEVSIFGPGKGESVAVHLGYGRWIIVDSCVDQISNTVPALDYLRRMGVALDQDVDMVLATHAHDDHIAGISQVLRECESAFFSSSIAMTHEDFIALLEEDYQAALNLRKSSYSEFRSVFDILADRRKNAPSQQHRKWGLQDQPLISRTWANGQAAHVTCLSPSHESVTRAQAKLAAAVPKPGQPRRLLRGDPNEFSIALWIESFDKVMLLGADLVKGPAGCGWAGILSNFSPSRRASLFKVPHHGAPNADEPRVWSELLTADPVVLLAPFRAGRRPRPDAADRARICSRTSQAYITAGPSLPSPSKAVKAQRAGLGHMVVSAQAAWGRTGHVQARSKAGATNWTVKLVPPGQDLCANLPQRLRRS
jgi:hypothetical protein